MVTEYPFRRFYEEVLSMAREGVPVTTIVEKIRQVIPDHQGRQQLLGHLRDSRNAFDAEGKDAAAETLDQVIEALETPEVI